MSLTVTINTDEIEEILSVLEQAPYITEQELTIAMKKAVAEIERQAVPKTTSNTGALRGPWSNKVTKGIRSVKGEVMNPKEYVIVMEKGNP